MIKALKFQKIKSSAIIMVSILKLLIVLSLSIFFEWLSSKRLVRVSLIRMSLSTSKLILRAFGIRLFLIIFKRLISDSIHSERSVAWIEPRSLWHFISLIVSHCVRRSFSLMHDYWTRKSLRRSSHSLRWELASETSWRSSWINWCSSELLFWRISWRWQSVVLLSFFKIRIIVSFLGWLWLIFFLIEIIFLIFMKMIIIFIWIMILLGLIFLFRRNRSALFF